MLIKIIAEIKYAFLWFKKREKKTCLMVYVLKLFSTTDENHKVYGQEFSILSFKKTNIKKMRVKLRYQSNFPLYNYYFNSL